VISFFYYNRGFRQGCYFGQTKKALVQPRLLLLSGAAEGTHILCTSEGDSLVIKICK